MDTSNNTNMTLGSNGAPPAGPINPKPELNEEIESLKNLFTEKITGIATKIFNDANTINKIAEQMRAIVNKNGSASEKIKELKELINDVDNNEDLVNAREKYQNEIDNLNLALTGKSPKSEDSAEGDEKKSKGILDFFRPKTTDKSNESFSKIMESYAKEELNKKGLELSNNQIKALATPKANRASKQTYINLNTQKPIPREDIIEMRNNIVKQANEYNRKNNNSQRIYAGGYLSNSRKLRRPSRRNTRDFFKFTRKSGESLGAKKMRKSRKKRRGRK